MATKQEFNGFDDDVVALDDDNPFGEEPSGDEEVDTLLAEIGTLKKERERQDAAKKEADAEFAENLRDMERQSPDYVEEEIPSEVEQTAAEIAKNVEEFTWMLRENLAREAEARRQAELVRDPETGEAIEADPFDASRLSRAAFASFMRGISAGGADVRDVPPGYEWTEWEAIIEGALR